MNKYSGVFTKGHSTGSTLTEMLVSLVLVGVVMIPMLFMSSAYFSAELVKTRDNMSVTHNVSQVVNTLINELGKARKILPTSDPTHLYYAYYDPTREQVLKRGFQLSANGSDLMLEALDYDEAGDTWTARSPYGVGEASILVIPSGTVFDYCQGATCSLTPSATVQPMSVKLSSWSFAGKDITLTLPDMEIHVASHAQEGGLNVTEKARLITSFAAAEAFGGTNLNLVALNPNLSSLTYLNASSGSSGLTTVHSGMSSGSRLGMGTQVDSTGRVFFHKNHTVGSPTAEFWTWHPSTGLSTIMDGGTFNRNLGAWAGHSLWSPEAGRLFIRDMDYMYTWNTSDGLSTLFWGDFGDSATQMNSYGHRYAVDNNGRLYSGNNTSALLTWKEGAGVSTILSGLPQLGNDTIAVDKARNVVYFGEYDNPGHFFTWNETDGLSTIIEGGANFPGYPNAVVVDSTQERVFIGGGNERNLYIWNPSDGLSTIQMGLFTGPLGSQNLYYTTSYTTTDYTDLVDPATGRLFLTVAGHAMTWQESTGLSTLVEWASTDAGMRVDKTTGRVFFGEESASTQFWTWHSSTGLSTLVFGRNDPGKESIVLDTATGRVFWGEENTGTGTVMSWHSSTGLSTIASGLDEPGSNNAIQYHQATGRLYFGEVPNNADETHEVLTWSASTGLSTVIDSIGNPGRFGAMAVNPQTGGVYFGDFNPAGTYYYWEPGQATFDLARSTHTGEPREQELSIEDNGATYSAMTYDVNHGMYLVDNTSTTVDRYTYNSGTSEFQRASQLNWSSWAATVGAVVTDQSNSAMALLDTGNEEIDIYADRTVDGVPAAPRELDLSTLATSPTTPTGLAFNDRTGAYLVLDSAIQSGTNVRLFEITDTDSNGVPEQGDIINIDVTAASLGVDATGETNFKILYNSQDNLLYLMAPSLATPRVFVLTLPDYL